MTNAKKPPERGGLKLNPAALLGGWFAAGLGVVLPFAITVAICWAIVSFIDKTIMPVLLPALPESWRGIAAALPGLGLVVALVALTVVGALAANFVGRFVVRTTERVVTSVPMVSSVYGSAKQIVETMTNPDGQSFKEAVLLEFPTKGQWSIAFVTQEECGPIERAVGADLVAVYVPSCPIPTSGFLIYVERSLLKPLDKGPEEVLKLVMSAGVVKEAAAPQGAAARESATSA